MTLRLVLDESSWAVASGLGADVLAAMESLANRIELASERDEGVCRHDNFYEAPAGTGLAIFNVLFDSDALLKVDRDLAARLQLALDQNVVVFDDAGLVSLDATLLGRTVFAPGISWAHSQLGIKRAVGVIPLPVDPTYRGQLPVTIEHFMRSLHFVARDQDHVEFFRDAIVFEDMDHDGIRRVAASAFPTLEWLASVWQELRVHKAYFFGHLLPTCVQHLAALDDRAAQLFHERPGGAAVTPTSLGVDVSNENGETRSHNPSKLDRTRKYGGKDEVVWWHTNFQLNVGRIHFLHVPNDSRRADRPMHGHIVIGVCKGHCVLPG